MCRIPLFVGLRAEKVNMSGCIVFVANSFLAAGNFQAEELTIPYTCHLLIMVTMVHESTAPNYILIILIPVPVILRQKLGVAFGDYTVYSMFPYLGRHEHPQLLQLPFLGFIRVRVPMRLPGFSIRIDLLLPNWDSRLSAGRPVSPALGGPVLLVLKVQLVSFIFTLYYHIYIYTLLLSVLNNILSKSSKCGYTSTMDGTTLDYFISNLA